MAETWTAGTDLREALQALVERGQGASAEAVMLRLLALRQEHPDAVVETRPIRVDDGNVVIQASVSVPGGGAGSGIAAAVVTDGDAWAEVVERTETTAIARALDTLGHVLRVPASDRAATGDTPTEPEAPAGPTAAANAPSPEPEREPEPEVAEPPRERFAPRMAESAPPVVNALRRANRRPQEIREEAPAPQQGPPQPTPPAPARPATAAPAAAQGDDAHLEEYSWNAFWTRARSLGLTPDKVTELLGRPANQMTPRDAVAGLVEAGAWPTPADE